MILYRIGNDFDLDAVIDLYRTSSLGERRPLDDRASMAAMLRNSNLVVTAWDKYHLIGIARALSDFVYATYLSDLIVRESHQRTGVGKELIRRVQAEAGAKTKVVLLSNPTAASYYPRLGFTPHSSAWVLRPGGLRR